MPGFRLKLNGLKNSAYTGFVQELMPFDTSFEAEYFFRGLWNTMMVKPILVGSIIVFFVQFPDEGESMALVYNEKDTWSDIEKESNGLTEAVGTAIEAYYSACVTGSKSSDSLSPGSFAQELPEGPFSQHHLN